MYLKICGILASFVASVMKRQYDICYSNKCQICIQFNLLLSPYPCFISLLYLDLYVLGDDALIS